MNKSYKKNIEEGFTLIELVIVIVILGILAATALPRFVNLQVNARVSALTGLQGAIISGIENAHSQALVNGTNTAATSTIVMDGTTVTMAFGYPDSSASGISTAMHGFSGWSSVTFTGATTTVGTGVTNCQLVYTAATSVNTPPSAVITTTGC